VEYFDESNKECGGSVVSCMLLKTENIEVKDPTLIAGWQPRVAPEPVKVGEWSHADVDPTTKLILGRVS
jgi:hypothetical protein